MVLVLLINLFKQNALNSVLQTEVTGLENQKEELMYKVEELKKEQAFLVQKPDPINSSSSLKYIKPEFLNVEWDHVILETFDEKIIIDSKPIMEEFSNQFRGIIETENPYPGGFRSGHPSFTFHIVAGEQQYTFNSLEHDFFMTSDYESFYRSHEDYTQLARAFLSKPSGYPEENLFSKLYYSGMVVGEKEFIHPIMDSFRIKGIASIFINMDKEEVAAPNITLDYQEKFTFYYFGEKYDLSLYDEYIHLSDEESTIDKWYRANKEQIEGILMSLRAG